ncbi:HAD family hydrolase [Thermoclostridium caenicola]|uniref:Putative hydrolase of the HAD superfamily n=1 Tax=Thermoclostridium caenicola TaxID=659425 RepID=A0A1M6JCD1_9FIRM|nr:HAD family hydrolase [Thermoclostridium caenicola]SHJ44282.1 putative hydrolase of the HAD superfamily [Thermoclostridium caenicola]
MVFPKMILFDYGHTLLHEPGFSTLRGEEALYRYITVNRNNLSPGEIHAFSSKIYEEARAARDMGFELSEWQLRKMLNEYLGIELSISMEEAERIFWEHTSYGDVMPQADIMLDYINAQGIRSAVISNISFSGKVLTERINRLLPNNRFEFVIASSDYGFRKPNPLLFELALRRAGLDASEVWFCGDNVVADIEGAAGAGIFPVWYEDLTLENPWTRKYKGLRPTCEHLHIHEWRELIEILERLKQ